MNKIKIEDLMNKIKEYESPEDKARMFCNELGLKYDLDITEAFEEYPTVIINNQDMILKIWGETRYKYGWDFLCIAEAFNNFPNTLKHLPHIFERWNETRCKYGWDFLCIAEAFEKYPTVIEEYHTQILEICNKIKYKNGADFYMIATAFAKYLQAIKEHDTQILKKWNKAKYKNGWGFYYIMKDIATKSHA